MDYKKIGEFIMNERKAKKLTQAKLAEQLFVSEKTISKWENGKGIPDTEFLPSLCKIFDVSINELLNGERLDEKNYVNKAEEKLFELQGMKEQNDKLLLAMEWGVAFLALIVWFGTLAVILCFELHLWLEILLGVGSFVIFLVAMFFGLKVEQVAGFYVCGKCNHKYIPKYSHVFFAPHINRTRFMKCPHCKHWAWNKKVIK